MGFYCLIEDPSALREIDGWMLSIVRRSMKLRNEILSVEYGMNCPTPNKKQLATGSWLDSGAWRGSDLPESSMPSLVRGWRSARKYYYTFGLEKVQAPAYNAYADVSELFDY